MNPPKAEWKISLHGGHSGEFCEHAEGSLREILEAAYQAGYNVFGVAEHMPRVEARFLYPKEIEWAGRPRRWTRFLTATRTRLRNSPTSSPTDSQCCAGLNEVVPQERYVELVQYYRQKYQSDYMVGSVHYLHDASIDGYSEANFLEMMERVGGWKRSPYSIITKWRRWRRRCALR